MSVPKTDDDLARMIVQIHDQVDELDLDDYQAELEIEKRELKLLFDYYLGENYSKKKFNKVLVEQISFVKKQHFISEKYSRKREKKNCRQEYLNEIGALSLNTNKKIFEILGKDDYHALYRADPEDCLSVIDESTFLKK